MNGPSFPPFASARAVLIGCATYHSRDLDAIPHSARNIRDLGDVITDRTLGGFAAEDVRLVDDPHKAQEVMGPVQAAADQAQDVLLVYYSGHGLLTAAGDLHLSLTESEPGQDWTSLQFSHLAGVVKQSGAKVKIVILDACYSGRAHSDLMGAESRLVTGQLAAFEGVYSLTSAPGHRTSKAPKGAVNSAFTGFLLAVAREGVRGEEPVLCLSDLYAEVRRRMRSTGFALPEECGKTGAGAFPFVRNRAFVPPAPKPAPAPAPKQQPEPKPEPAPEHQPAPRPAPVPRAATRPGGPTFTTVLAGGYRMGEVNARLAEVVAAVAHPDRWLLVGPPYFRTETGRKTHGFDFAEVEAHIERHRLRPATFADALRLVLLLQRFTFVRDTWRPRWFLSMRRKRYGMADGERLVGRATDGAARAVVFTDTHLCVRGSQNLMRVPYSGLAALSLSVERREERVVTVTDQAGIAEDVVFFVTTLRYGGDRMVISEGSNHPVLSALRRFLPAMADLRARHPECFEGLS
ncbi:caspase domain-containing protein [Streptomyces sp. NPDC127051]|uniref:caspase family protein n=1 Tax=Streptomyces sp. NPDC127051 TaxID=3347119 RepID=UPI0036517464